MLINVAFKIFDMCILLILCNKYEMWRAETSHKRMAYSKIKKVHLQFFKYLLGVNRSTTNCLFLAELGRYLLLVTIKTKIVGFIQTLRKQ